MVTVHHLDKVTDTGVREMRVAVNRAEEEEVHVVLLTSALPEEVQAWLYEHDLIIDYLFADATAIETMMRGNPGFMYLKDATVVDKCRKAGELKIEK